MREFATIVAQMCGTKVIYEIPDPLEASGYSKATKARLDGSKLKLLGWRPKYDIKTGVDHTITILKEISQNT